MRPVSPCHSPRDTHTREGDRPEDREEICGMLDLKTPRRELYYGVCSRQLYRD